MRFSIKAAVCAVLSSAVIIMTTPLYANASSDIKGDVNGDGKLSALDSFMIQRNIAGLIEFDDTQKSAADFDNSGKISLADALKIQRAISGLDNNDSSTPTITLPSSLTINCGERTDLGLVCVPESALDRYKVEYKVESVKSTDNSGEDVLVMTNLGTIKAHHPGTCRVKVNISCGFSAECTVTVVNETRGQTVYVGDNSLNITKKMMTRNDCYNTENDYKIQGIVVHSTASPGVMADQWYNSWNLSYEKGETDREVCVHSFLDDQGVYQYLPYEEVGWHVGGAANRTHIGFEICEPYGFYYSNNAMIGYDPYAQQAYFNKIWKNATVYCAYLCEQYNIDVKNIISHKEANQLGLGTAHGDPDHWFIKHGKTMNDFRADVAALLKNNRGNIYADKEFYISGTAQEPSATTAPTAPYDMFDVWSEGILSLRDY